MEVYSALQQHHPVLYIKQATTDDCIIGIKTISIVTVIQQEPVRLAFKGYMHLCSCRMFYGVLQ
ncbi:hypothetical protein GCM10023091_00020 [Ravibacter arvi]|uniref:Uncharacterized protein n=1 Tax=Ravibacter arvi TaxID=2051041 RepID=A0ABP8LIW8_9BACT